MAPFDGLITDYAAPKPNAPDLTRPSLEGLAWVLENPQAWPRGWTWDFANIEVHHSCGTAGCAIGIARYTWPRLRRLLVSTSDSAFGGAYSDMLLIFEVGSNDSRVTPAVVAGRIRDHLAGRPIRYLVEGDRDAR